MNISRRAAGGSLIVIRQREKKLDFREIISHDTLNKIVNLLRIISLYSAGKTAAHFCIFVFVYSVQYLIVTELSCHCEQSVHLHAKATKINEDYHLFDICSLTTGKIASFTLNGLSAVHIACRKMVKRCRLRT